jgi:hypothetical protein
MDQLPIQRGSYAVRHESGLWEDELGALGPYKPGVGPRSNPEGWFPTGPDLGGRLPDIVAPAHTGEIVDVREASAGGPAVMVFYRSAVW